MGDDVEEARSKNQNQNQSQAALQIIAQFTNLPRLVVFDLDYTLWPLYCEFYDEDYKPKLYEEASGILYALKEKGIQMAVASRTPSPQVANSFLQNLGLDPMFVAKEIYPSWTHKTQHFEGIHTKTGVPFTSMLFFDDEDRNIQAVSKMGVTCILVEDGVNLGALRQGLAEFSQKSS
ncbi:Magnesium-dependent phosphatase-1 type [Trema orientale]|uniref:Magnesium-dependent phosphatase-1 type n=1 Tax=Trema orientale TaxID=63057 RepID=A0A2P5EGR8_TREOI|nr:Magnesium-dependent phosphatase-1 type [Trema orientale]